MRILTTLIAIALVGAGAVAQDKPAAKKETKKTVKALPKGQVKVLEAIVMEVRGTAQARAKPGEKWAKLKINDVLKPGATIRTGRKSHVALRVGMNATVLIERQSRVAIPEIVQAGDTLRTRVSMSFGKADVKVDRIGLKNDFGVATPTATLAVRGTIFRIMWDAVNGFRAIGVIGNKLVAIEVRYINKVIALLSGADSTSSAHKLPAIDGFYDRYFEPLTGAVTKGERGDPNLTGTGHIDDPKNSTGLKAAQKSRGSKSISSSGDSDRGPSDEQ